MKNEPTPLPPGLVEKMKANAKNHLEHMLVEDENFYSMMDNLSFEVGYRKGYIDAQIAVDYAGEESRELIKGLKYIASADTPPSKFKTKAMEAIHLQQVIDNLTREARSLLKKHEVDNSQNGILNTRLS